MAGNEIQSYKAWKGKKRNGKHKFGNKFKKKVAKEEIISLEGFDPTKVEKFEDFPLTSRTKAGLRKGNFVTPTAIQRAAINPGLTGKDVLGGAKTGSGKTLAFIIPILECLNKLDWNALDGPGALVISPTRELAYQIFEVLKVVGCKHNFSAGLLIGGNNVEEEARSVGRTNIIICTPGRLLQHMDSTSYFHLNNLKILVLDEADRILDMGFRSALDAILQNLPKERQTLLFSATQTKSVKDLARLSLRDPVYISVHSEAKHATPSGLKQRYISCNLGDKINILYSFLRSHTKSKCLVFVSSCKQVSFLFAAFCKLRPGVSLMHLHGRMNQVRRMSVYQEFCRKKFAVLFATDIAARGLDFPEVDWVVQLDCPEDADTYIHRAGRTARYNGNGNALLVLLPSEKNQMLQHLQKKKVPISVSEINMNKVGEIDGKLQSFCAEDKEFKAKAQRSFVAYIRSVFLMKDKSVFNPLKLPFVEFSSSLGLAIPPRVRFLERHIKAQKAQKAQGSLGSQGGEAASKESGFGLNEDDDGDLMVVKCKNVFDDKLGDISGVEVVEGGLEGEKSSSKRSKAAEAKRLMRKGMRMNQQIKFDEGGSIAESFPPLAPSGDSSDNPELKPPSGEEFNIVEAKKMMKIADARDREEQRMKIKDRHRAKRLADKEERRTVQAQREGRSHDVMAGDVTIGSGDVSDFKEDLSNSVHDIGNSDNDLSDDDDDVIANDDIDNTDDDSSDDGGVTDNDEQPSKRPKLIESNLADDENLALYFLQNKKL